MSNLPNVRITNAAAVYTIMMLVFIAGMWVILAFGSTFEAQPDLAGEWVLSPEGRGDPEPLNITIEQSGRYVRMKSHGKQYDLRINSSGDPIELSGDGVTATFDPSPAPDVYRVTLTTPSEERRVFSGRIKTRTYPRAPAARDRQDKQMTPSNPNAGALPSAQPSTPSTNAR